MSRGFFAFLDFLSAGLDSGFQGCGDLLQGKGRGTLLGQVGDMEEAYAHMGSRVAVQQGVQHVVTYEGACGVGYGGGDAVCLDGIGHGHDRDGGEIPGGPVGEDKGPTGLIAFIVRNSGIPDVDGDTLGSHGGPAAGLPDAKNHIRLKFPGGFQNRSRGFAENSGDQKLVQRVFSDGIGKPLYRLPSGIDIRSAEGIKSGDKKPFAQGMHLQ